MIKVLSLNVVECEINIPSEAAETLLRFYIHEVYLYH